MKRLLFTLGLLLVISLPGWATAAPGQADRQPLSWEDDLAMRPTPEGWPSHVKPIYMDDQGFGIDKEKKLYWNGKAVKTEQTIGLELGPMIVAWIAAVSALLTAVSALLTAILNWRRFCGYGKK